MQCRVCVCSPIHVSQICLVCLSPPGNSGSIAKHYGQSEWERWLSVQFLQQQLWPEGQSREGTHLHHHRSLPGTSLIQKSSLVCRVEASLVLKWGSCGLFSYAYLKCNGCQSKHKTRYNLQDLGYMSLTFK